jgi:hypothetical protein
VNQDQVLNERSQRVFGDVFAGLGLGLLLGIVVGLSLTPVVSIVIGALTSMLAVFLGLEGGDDRSVLGRVRINSVRIGCFALATVFGLLLGLYMRVNEPFGPSLEEELKTWTEQHYEENWAREIVLFNRTGIKPKGAEISEKIAAQKQAAGSHALFSDLTKIDLCKELNPARLETDVEASILRVYARHDSIKQIGGWIESAPSAERLEMLENFNKIVCAAQVAARRAQP